MDWKLFVHSVSCSNIKPKTCFWTKEAPINWSLGSNIMEPGPQYIGAPQNVVFQNSLRWMLLQRTWEFKLIFKLGSGLLEVWISLYEMKYFRHTSLFWKTKIWWAPLYWGPGSNILEPLFVQIHVFGFIFEHETLWTKSFQSMLYTILWYTKPGFIRTLAPHPFPESWN